jgi:uncharacterized FAD-dependent dehydrogenase
VQKDKMKGACMSLRTLSDVKLSLGQSEETLRVIAERKLGRKAAYFAIKKKSLDARDKNNIKYIYTIEFSASPYSEETTELPRLPKEKLPKDNVMVVGSGPAGLFCALRLIEHGITPIVVERGAPVEEREKDIGGVLEFVVGGVFDSTYSCNRDYRKRLRL